MKENAKENKPKKPRKKKVNIVTEPLETPKEAKTIASSSDPKMVKAFSDLATFNTQIPDKYLHVIAAPEVFVANNSDGITSEFKIVLLMVNYHILFGCYNYFVNRVFHPEGIKYFIDDLKKYWAETHRRNQSLSIFLTRAIAFCDYMMKLVDDLRNNYSNLVLDWYNDNKISKEKMTESLNIYNAIMGDKDRFLKEKESLQNALRDLERRGTFGGENVI